MTHSLEAIAGSVLDRPTESILGIGYSLLITAQQTGGLYELMKFVVPGGHGPPPHIHQHEDECFYVIEGEFDVTAGGRSLHAVPGTYIHLPRGQAHAFRNTTTAMSSFLCWVMPGNLAGFFDAFKRPWPADAEQPTPVNDEDIQKLLAAASKYGVQILTGE